MSSQRNVLHGAAAGAVFAAAALAGCISPAPSAPQPETLAIPSSFGAAFEGQPLALTDWWRQFGDPELDRLVERALARNASLGAARSNIRAAQAALEGERLNQAFATSSTATGNAGRAANPNADISASLNGSLGASWEWDLFGRIDAQIASAEYNLEIVREARRDVAVTVASETALAYSDLRGAQRRLAVGQENAAAQAEGLELLLKLFDNGRATRLDIERAQSLYRTTLASLPRQQAIILSARSRLAALTGQFQDTSDAAELDPPGSIGLIPEHQGAIVSGSPDQLIRRRPDVRQAEAVIAQRLALGQVERASLFPTLAFNADVFSLINEANDGLSGDSFGFGIGPALRWSGPDLRRVRARIDGADASSLAAMDIYEQTVRDAVSEAESALSGYAQEIARQADLEQAAQSARRAFELARLRFDEGLDDYLDVLDAQRSLLDSEDRLAESRLQAARSAIFIYRALGGIWTNDSLDASANSNQSE